MNGNNGNNGSRRNGNNGRARANKMERAPTHHMERPRRGVRNLANARAVAQAAPQVRVSGPVRGSRKASRMNQNKKPYARGSKKNTKKANNNISLHGLSFGNSFSMKRFNPKKAAQSYAPSAASSAFVPQNQQQAFQLQMNEAVAKQNAAYQQKQDIITQHRSNAAIRGWAKRRDKAAAALAAASAAVERAEMDIEGQGRMSRAASNIEIAHAQQALAAAQEAQRTALDEYTALQQALADLGSTSTSSSSAANYANENNGSARANNGSASASAASSESPANFFGKFKP